MSSETLLGMTITFRTFCFEKAKLLVFKDSLLHVLGISQRAGMM